MKLINYQISTAFSSITSTGTLLPLTAQIAGGVDYNARIGRQIRIHTVSIEGVVAGGQTAGVADDAYNALRCVVFTAMNGTSAPATMDLIMTPQVYTGLGKVFVDRKFILQSPGVNGAGYTEVAKVFRMTAVINREFMYTNTSGAAAPYDLFVSFSSDSTVAPNPGFVSGRLLIQYSDA